MSIKFVYTLLLSLLGVLPFCVPLQFTDSAVAPQPVANYVRYVTFLANGTRTYVCSPGSGSDNYTLTAFDYVLSDAETGTSTPLGKHELMVQKDANGANSIFFTSNGIFTYWVGKTTKLLPNPGPNPNPLDLTLEQELRTEGSDPKPSDAGKYDMGPAVYATRFGPVGGNVPAGTKCTAATQTILLQSTAYYSMWKQIA